MRWQQPWTEGRIGRFGRCCHNSGSFRKQFGGCYTLISICLCVRQVSLVLGILIVDTARRSQKVILIRKPPMQTLLPRKDFKLFPIGMSQTYLRYDWNKPQIRFWSAYVLAVIGFGLWGYLENMHVTSPPYLAYAKVFGKILDVLLTIVIIPILRNMLSWLRTTPAGGNSLSLMKQNSCPWMTISKSTPIQGT